LVYSSALIGWGSEVLGYDDRTSTDHNWGPRFFLFLSKSDRRERPVAISQALRVHLPATFRGYPTVFRVCAQPDQQAASSGGSPNISIDTVEDFLDRYLGHPFGTIDPVAVLSGAQAPRDHQRQCVP
jgi:hypothetical protein